MAARDRICRWMRAHWLFALAAVLLSPVLQAQAIRIGDINSYARVPLHLEPYRKGWRLAQEQINAAGGVDGRRIEVFSRDDGTRADTAVRLATELVERHRVHALMGGFTESVSLALADYAARKKILFVASTAFTDDLVGRNANRYTFRLRPSAALQASMLLPEAVRPNTRRWAILYPANTYGFTALAGLRSLLMKQHPSAEVVYEQAVPIGNIDEWGLVLTMEESSPQVLFSLLFGTDLHKLIVAGDAIGLFGNMQVVNLLAGQPEDLALLKGPVSEGWWVTGYPVDDLEQLNLFGHRRFVTEYRKRWGETPRAGSVLGYVALVSIVQAIRRAKSTDAESLVDAFEGLELSTPVGMIEWRKSDHQSTMGVFVGRLTSNESGAAIERWRWRFESPLRYLPPEPRSSPNTKQRTR